MKCEFVHEDIRGHIISVTGITTCPEMVFVWTDKGYARGGCIHDTDETVLVIEGSIMLHCDYSKPMRYNNQWQQIDEGDPSIIIPAGVPHFYISLENSLIMEYGPDNANTKKDIEMRNRVERINRELK